MKIRIIFVIFCVFLAAYTVNANTYYDTNQNFNAESHSGVTTTGSNGTANNGQHANGMNGGIGGATASGGANACGFGNGGNGGAGGNGGDGSGSIWSGVGGGGGSGGGGGAGGLGGVYFFKNNIVNFNSNAFFYNNEACGGQGANGGTGGWGGTYGGQFGANGTAGTEGGSTGGAISSSYSTVNFEGAATFTGNKAQYGGAISYVGGTYNFKGATTNFSNNIASASGGAIAVYKGALTLQNNIVFQGNQAQYITPNKAGWGYGGDGGNGGSGGNGHHPGSAGSNGTTGGEGLTGTSAVSISGVGGAIFAVETTINFGNVSFSSNSASHGGAIFLKNSNLIFSGTSSFKNNTASDKGGAIYADNKTTITISTNSSVNFTSNTASKYGGAIYADDTNINFQGSVSFTNNTSDIGGAIYAVNKTTITISGNSSFSNNTASTYGGAITANNSNINFQGNASFARNAANYGGAMFLTKSKLTVLDVEFIGNKALNNNGGAIYAQDDTTITFSGTSSFTNNTASTLGGAIVARTNTTITFSGDSSFTNNTASTTGGAIYLTDTNINFQESVSFTSNTVTSTFTATNGGAIYIYKSNLAVSKDVEFVGNKSSNGRGGAIYAVNKTTITISGNSSFINNTAVTYGGAIHANDSNINFQGNASFLSNTVTNNHGGAIYLDKSNLAASKDIEFIGNRGQNGGAIYAISNTGITFSGDSSFTNNTALTYGGAIYATDTNINFLGNTSFASNTAANYSGGAICLTRSNLTVSKDAEFIGNKAERHGGAVTAVSNTTIILSGNSSFSNNAALAYGGAIYAYDAINMSFQGSASFTNNTSDIGGAVYAGNNTAITVLGNLSFADNAALGSGGGIYLRNSSLLVEGYDTTTIFKNNTAYSGSAIRFDGGVTALFANGNFEFQINGSSMNTSMGTIDVFNSQSDYNSPLIFKNVASLTASGNVAAYGGFIAIRHNDLKISGDNINIGNNMAFLGYGGAIHAESADIELEGTLNFENNFAHINGGAIYASVSTITIKSIGDGITFRNNSMNASAGSESNDIYINDSMLLLYGTNYIEFSGGISGNSLSEINKYDENTVYLGGKTDFEGVLNIAEGSVSITAPNVNIAEINIAQDAILTGTTVHTASAKKLNVDGQIQFGVDFTNNTADKFIVSLGTTTLSDSSKWSVLQIGRSRKDKVYTILESDFIIGEFSNEKLNIADLEYSLQYYDNRIDLVSRYIGYQALQGNTANQKAIAGLFNTIYFDEERFNAMSDDMVNLTDDIFELRQISATLFEKAAANLSGKFYADIIMSAGEMYNNSILFNRLNVDLLSYKNSKNFWTQGIMRSKTLPSDENQLGNFKNTAVGGMFGADIVYGKSMIIGLFGQYLANEYLQDDNCADGQEIGFGLYAFKALGSALNLKSSLSYNTQKIKAKRSFSVSETYKPEAEFNLSAIKIAALAEKDFKIKDKLSIMPFIGVAGAAIFNGEIKEEGANNVNLIIDGATNSRLDGTFGINANYNINKFLSLYGGFNGRAAIFGKKGTIKEVLAREREHSMEIESAEELLYLGLDLQLDYKIGENFIVYINGNYGTNSQYLVGLGLSYRVMSNKI